MMYRCLIFIPKGDLDHVLIRIKYTFRKYALKKTTVLFVESAPVTREEVVVMQRRHGAGNQQGTVCAYLP